VLTITDNARTAVEDLTTQARLPDGGGVRIAADATGALELRLVTTPEPDDAVVQSGDARVFVDAQTAPTLDDLALDTEPTGADGAFVLVPQVADEVFMDDLPTDGPTGR